VSDSANTADEAIIDASGLYVIPGLVDVHIHGAMGGDFSDGDAQGLLTIARYLHSCGVTAFCPTSMTLPEQQLVSAFKSISEVSDDDSHAFIAGIHMEGPFLSAEKKGAQKASYLHAPDIGMFRRLSKACNNQIRIITIAPELDGSEAFIKEFHTDLAISIGHSAASYDVAVNAFNAGANHVTHLFNAMPPLHHRNPGIIGAAADCPHAMAEIICDGIHIHPSVVRNAFRMFGDDRMILISDAMRATGMEDGTYDLGGQSVTKKGRLATLADGTIAGSVTNLFDCMKNAVKFGIPLASAVKAASYNPAKSIGLEHTLGILSPGARADVLLIDSDLNLVRVI
jgi:N-acetylglucosamine-6-phosphate deacetylase